MSGAARDASQDSDGEPCRPLTPLEVWGGVEATVNRVGNRYFDQMRRSGHFDRLEDLDAFAALGIKAIRYPVLWEHVAPDGIESADWSWPDARLTRLRELNIRPIVGLLHHGSGPLHTSLIDPRFPEQLAEYALHVATRFPWVQDYTPVNEPLTTARFSALYGHWYPHASDDPSFARAIVNQCKATALAMRAIRSVNPDARLVQTEDLGRTHSTPHLAYQAHFDNERRWLTFDLLTGRLSDEDEMWRWLASAGIPVAELQWFRENPCPPDILAVNYYLTSERFLDERVDRYPAETPGSNGRDTYVDVSALHVLHEGLGGFRAALTETWNRYQRPIAIGEAHLGGTPEEQMRWLHDAWSDAQELRTQGVDVRGVTVWALLGSFDWTSLVTCENGHYERGPFDVRGPVPRPTALRHMVRELSATGSFGHPLLAFPGWWQRPDRLTYGDSSPDAGAGCVRPARLIRHMAPDRLMIIGTQSPLRSALVFECELRHVPADAFDANDVKSIERCLKEERHWAVVLTDTPEPGPAGDRSAGQWSAPPHRLASACAQASLPLVTYSDPWIFDGKSDLPYLESHAPSPHLSVGEAIASGERETAALHSGTLLLRVGEMFGPGICVQGIAPGSAWHLLSPAYLPDIANATLDLLIDQESGVWHLTDGDTVTAGDFHLALLSALGLHSAETEPRIGEPRMLALGSERGWLLPSWESALAHYVDNHGESIVALVQASAD